MNEIKAETPDLNVEILGINYSSDSAYSQLMAAGRTLPLLQDTREAAVVSAWGVTHRDVRILDAQNRVQAVYNLTEHSLSFPENRATLKGLFLLAAKAVDSDADGLLDDWELKYFGNLAVKPNEDPDGDSSDNLTEFAFGTTPTDLRSYAPVRLLSSLSGGGKAFAVVFRQRAGSMLNFTVELSPDLKQWTPASGEVASASTLRNLFDGTGTFEARYSFNQPPASGLAEFFRIRAVPKRLP